MTLAPLKVPAEENKAAKESTVCSSQHLKIESLFPSLCGMLEFNFGKRQLANPDGFHMDQLSSCFFFHFPDTTEPLRIPSLPIPSFSL